MTIETATSPATTAAPISSATPTSAPAPSTTSISPSPTRVPIALDDTTYRDHTLFFNSLLPILDLAGFIYAIYLAKTVHALWFAATPHAHAPDDRLLLMIALLASFALYDRRFISVASRAQTAALIRCYLTGFALLAIGVWLATGLGGALSSIPASEIALWLAFGFSITALIRVILANAVQYCVRRGVLTETVAIVGAGPRTDRLIEFLRNAKPVTPELLGVFDDEPALSVVNADGSSVEATAIDGNIENLIALGKTRRIDWIFVSLRHADEVKLASIVHRLKALSVPVALAPPALEIGSTDKRVDYIADAMPVTLLKRPIDGWRSTVRTAGQFLPRWIVTQVTVAALIGQSAWSLFQSLRATQSDKHDPLVCPLDRYDLNEFMPVAHNYGQSRHGYVVTPNVDHLIRLHEEPAFRELYSAAEFVLMDSRFVANLLRWSGGARLPVCTGSDLTVQLFANLNPSDRIVVIGGDATQIATLQMRYGLRNIAHHNPPMGFIRDPEAVDACAQFVEMHSPFRYCLLAVGSPQQEKLAFLLHQRGIARGLTLCVGASIDFMTGVEKRAPQWMRNVGIEWVYRLLQNPARLARRYLVRGPRIFGLLRKTRFVLRERRSELPAVEAARAA